MNPPDGALRVVPYHESWTGYVWWRLEQYCVRRFWKWQFARWEKIADHPGKRRMEEEKHKRIALGWGVDWEQT